MQLSPVKFIGLDMERIDRLKVLQGWVSWTHLNASPESNPCGILQGWCLTNMFYSLQFWNQMQRLHVFPLQPSRKNISF